MPELTPIPTGPHFTTWDRASHRAGGDVNLRQWIDKNSSQLQAEIDAGWDRIAYDVDSDIRLAWRVRTTEAMVLNDDETNWVAETATLGVVAKAYEGRGLTRDQGDDVTGKMEVLREQYEARLQMIRDGVILLDALDEGEGDSAAAALDAFLSLSPAGGGLNDGDCCAHVTRRWPYNCN